MKNFTVEKWIEILNSKTWIKEEDCQETEDDDLNFLATKFNDNIESALNEYMASNVLGSYTQVSVPHSLFTLTNMKVIKLTNMNHH